MAARYAHEQIRKDQSSGRSARLLTVPGKDNSIELGLVSDGAPANAQSRR